MERQARTMDAAARAASLRAEVVREADIRQLQIRLAEMERRLGCAARMATHVIGQMTWMGPELEQLVRHVLQNWFVYGVAVLAIDRSDRPTIIEGYRVMVMPVDVYKQHNTFMRVESAGTPEWQKDIASTTHMAWLYNQDDAQRMEDSGFGPPIILPSPLSSLPGTSCYPVSPFYTAHCDQTVGFIEQCALQRVTAAATAARRIGFAVSQQPNMFHLTRLPQMDITGRMVGETVRSAMTAQQAVHDSRQILNDATAKHIIPTAFEQTTIYGINASSVQWVPTDGGLKTETEDAVDRVMARIYQACGFSPTEFGIQSGASANRSAHHNVKAAGDMMQSARILYGGMQTLFAALDAYAVHADEPSVVPESVPSLVVPFEMAVLLGTRMHSKAFGRMMSQMTGGVIGARDMLPDDQTTKSMVTHDRSLT